MNAVGWQGAEITGSDLRGPFDAAFRARALETLHAHKTVCYRDQNLTDAQFRDFALLFGPLEPRIAAYDRGERFQDLHLMTNVAADGTLSAGHQDTANRGWHSDKSYKPKPSMTTLLYALAVPNERVRRSSPTRRRRMPHCPTRQSSGSPASECVITGNSPMTESRASARQQITRSAPIRRRSTHSSARTRRPVGRLSISPTLPLT